jgi:hypothetical protein
MRFARRAVGVACILLSIGGVAVAQDAPAAAEVRPPGPALLSVYYTDAPQPTGVYLRGEGGAVKRVWSGRPYDVLALPDRSTVVCERAAGRVVWLDPQGRVLFERKGLQDPVDVEVTDGGLIVADSGHGRVVWLDATGRVLRTKELPYPNTVTRLSSGNTLVTTYHHREVVEVDEANEVVWRAKVPGSGSIFRATRRKDGDTVVVVGEVGAREVGRILVLDPRGRVLLEETFPAGGVVDFEPIDEL